MDNEDWIAWLAKNGIPLLSKQERESKQAHQFGRGLSRKRKSEDGVAQPKVLFYFSII